MQHSGKVHDQLSTQIGSNQIRVLFPKTKELDVGELGARRIQSLPASGLSEGAASELSSGPAAAVGAAGRSGSGGGASS